VEENGIMIEGLYGLGRQATKFIRFVQNFATFARHLDNFLLKTLHLDFSQ